MSRSHRYDLWRIGGQEVAREPISLSIGIAAITGAEAVTGIAIGFESAALVGSSLVGAGLLAASIVPSLLAKKPDGSGAIGDTAFGANNPGITLNSRQPTPSKHIIYGRVRTGGALFFEKVKPPYLYHGWAIAAHEIDGFEDVTIATDHLAFSVTTALLPAGILTPIGKRNDDGTVGLSPDYVNNLILSLRTGTTTQTIDPILSAGFASLDTQFRQRGVATMVLRYKYPGSTTNDFQAMWGNVQAPNPLALVKGRKIYDPRDPTQIMWSDPRDLDEIAAAEATWKWSNNAALVQADYLVQPYGGRILPSRMDYDKIADAADYDDDAVGTNTAGELIARHTIDGVVTLNQSPSDTLNAMLTANRGFVLQMAGKTWVSSSRPQDAILTITDDLLVGGVDFQGGKAKRDLVNRVLSRFIDSNQEYQQVDGPTLDREDLQEDDGEILPATLSLPFTLDYRRVERLQKAFLESARLGKTLSLSVSLLVLKRAGDALIGAAVNFDSELFSVANGLYRVISVGFADGFSSLQLQLSEYDPQIELDWNATDDEVMFTVANLNLT